AGRADRRRRAVPGVWSLAQSDHRERGDERELRVGDRKLAAPPAREAVADGFDLVPNQTQSGGNMDTVKMSLCPSCTMCPEVEIAGDEVKIGEAGNLAVLKKEEWNVLVELITSGRLGRI